MRRSYIKVKSSVVVPQHYDKFYVLSIGQSNLFSAGQGVYPSYLSDPNPNVLLTRTGTFAPMQEGTAAGSGLELNMGYLLQQHYNETIHILKYAVSATRLSPLPGSTDWHPSSEGEYFDNLITYVTTAIDNMIADGKNPQIQGLLVYIGESDANAGVSKENFKQYLIDAITAFRGADFANRFLDANLKVIIIRTHLFNASQSLLNIRAAEEEVAEEIANIELVSADYLPTNEGDPIHINRAGLMLLGQRVFHNWIGYVDDEAPSVPSGLAEMSKTASGFTVSWSAATDNIQVRGYVVAIENATSGTGYIDQPETTALTFVKAGLSDGTAYNVRVKAIDIEGNESAYSASIQITTEESAPLALEREVWINIAGSANPTDIANWNEFVSSAADPFASPQSGFLDTDGVEVDWLSIGQVIDGSHDYNINHSQAPNKPGLYPVPDEVMRHGLAGSSLNGMLVLSGFPADRSVEIECAGTTRFLGTNSARSHTTYKVGAQEFTMVTGDNQTGYDPSLYASFDRELPDSNGDVFIETLMADENASHQVISWIKLKIYSGGGTVEDSTAPALQSAVIEEANPDRIVLTFDEAVTATNVGWSVATGFTVLSLTGSGTTVLVLHLSKAATAGETVTLSYSAETGDVKDVNANALEGITNSPVTNNIPTVTPLASPSNPVTANVHSFGAVLSWNAVANASSYDWELSDDNFATTIASGDVQETCKVVYELPAETSAKLRVKAVSTNPLFLDSAWTEFVINTPAQEAAAPLQRITTHEYISNTAMYKGKAIGMEIYLPAWVIANPAPVHPMIFAHGAGENSNITNGPDYARLRSASGYARYFNLNANNNVNYPVISLQLPRYGQNWTPELGAEALNEAKSLFPFLDISVIGVAGWSNGKLPWLMLKKYPQRVAVCTPYAVAGEAPSGSAACPAVANNPGVWIFVGKNDSIGNYGGTLTAYNNMVACSSGPTNLHLTVYSDGSHDCVANTIAGTSKTVEAGTRPYPDNGETVHDFIETHLGIAL